jgi:drug/metabolite transporter (DMT)-like permease
VKRLFLLAFIWGWSFLFIKVAVAGMTPPTVALLRVALGAAVLVIVLSVRRQSLPQDSAFWRHVTVAALFGNVLPFTMLAWGEERITSALTAVLNASTPLFTAVAAAFVLRDRLRPLQVAGLLLGLAGVGVAAGFTGADVAHSSVLGSLASVGAGACYGIAFAYMRRHLTGVSPMTASAGQLLAASVLLAPAAVFTTAVDGIELSATRVTSIVLLGVVGTGLAYVLNYRVLAELGATKASLVTYLIPVVAVLVGVVVLDEPFSLRLVAGGVLIVAGIGIVHERLLTPRARPPVGATAVVLVALLLPLVGCGDDDGNSGERGGPCGPVRREDADPSSSQHVLPGAPPPSYLSDPPTSGPHQPGAPLEGVLDEPLTKPVQVAVLEAGQVLIQHRDLDADDEAALAGLAGPDVVVAPNPELPDRVVATAWLFKLTCDEVVVDELRAFVDDHVGRGPGSD